MPKWKSLTIEYTHINERAKKKTRHENEERKEEANFSNTWIKRNDEKAIYNHHWRQAEKKCVYIHKVVDSDI